MQVEQTGAVAERLTRRVSIVGTPGSGKTSVGRQVADRLDVAFVELDAIFHQPDWGELPSEDFRARVAEVLEGDGWVIDGNYSAVQDLVWRAADTVVWLDLPKSVVMRRVTLRTLRRAITREELWKRQSRATDEFLSTRS